MTADLHAQLDLLIQRHGEDVVQRVLDAAPVLSLIRDASDYDIECAAGAARRDGPYGSLVLEVPERQGDPVEAIWLSRVRVTQQTDINVIPMTKQQRRRNGTAD